MTLEPGTLLENRYRIEALIGEGGFGAVYRAMHTEVERPVAIKVIKSGGGDAQQAATLEARFRREARLIAQLKHPSTVTLHDSWITDGTLFMALEFIEGETLSAVISREAPMPPGRVADLIDQAAGALAEAHAQGLVHRDVKPPNLIVTVGHDGRPLLKLLDFGIAKIVDDAHPDTVETQKGTIIGSPPYMPPEQILGHEVTPATDQYALAVVAYEMLCGRRPFSGTVRQLLTQHIQKPPPAMPAEAGVPVAAQKVLARALAKHVQQRFDDIRAFAIHLRAALEGNADTLAGVGLTESLGPTGPITVTDSAAPLGSTVDGNTSASFEWRGAVSESTVESTLPRSGRRSVLMVLPLLALAAGGGWWLASMDNGDAPGKESAADMAMVFDPVALSNTAAPLDAGTADSAAPDAGPTAPDAAVDAIVDARRPPSVERRRRAWRPKPPPVEARPATPTREDEPPPKTGPAPTAESAPAEPEPFRTEDL